MDLSMVLLYSHTAATTDLLSLNPKGLLKEMSLCGAHSGPILFHTQTLDKETLCIKTLRPVSVTRGNPLSCRMPPMHQIIQSTNHGVTTLMADYIWQPDGTHLCEYLVGGEME